MDRFELSDRDARRGRTTAVRELTRRFDSRFEEQELKADSGPWALVRDVLVASDSTPRLKASKVTKILHRKRPELVPIFDSKVAGYYGVTPIPLAVAPVPSRRRGSSSLA